MASTISAGTTSGTAGGTGTVGGNGGNSSVTGLTTAIGGGGGGGCEGTNKTPTSGGSGGGGSQFNGAAAGASGTIGQGNSGGTGYEAGSAGGGGGATTAGGNATNTIGGNGGNGITFTISGTSQTYCGGGGGGVTGSPLFASSTAGTGGTGGGGNGSGNMTSGNANGNPATYYGGGGGGASLAYGFTTTGGNGYQGIVIISYVYNVLLSKGIQFSGSNYLTTPLYNSISFQNPNTLFIVLSGLNVANAGGLLLYKGAASLAWNSAGYKKIWLGNTSNSGFDYGQGLYPSFVANSGDYSIQGYPLNYSLPAILCLQTTNSSNISYYVNNLSVVNNNYNLSLNTDTGSTLSIGNSSNATPLKATINEIIHYNNSITDTDRTTLTVSLAIKWGITLPNYTLPVLVNPGTVYYSYSNNITSPQTITNIQQSASGLNVGPLIWYIGSTQSIQPLKIPGLTISSVTLPNGNGDRKSVV